MDVRRAEAEDVDHLARVWHGGWHDAHARIVPAELTRIRTLESFRPRLLHALADTRVVGPARAPVGFCIVKGSELYQLFVSAEARGSGVAAALMTDAEARLAAAGVATANHDDVERCLIHLWTLVAVARLLIPAAAAVKAEHAGRHGYCFT